MKRTRGRAPGQSTAGVLATLTPSCGVSGMDAPASQLWFLVGKAGLLCVSQGQTGPHQERAWTHQLPETL